MSEYREKDILLHVRYYCAVRKRILGRKFEIECVIYCILASCYIRFTLKICSFLHQCNIHFLLFIIRRHISASHGHLQVL
jgi:hypothetical protein